MPAECLKPWPEHAEMTVTAFHPRVPVDDEAGIGRDRVEAGHRADGAGADPVQAPGQVPLEHGMRLSRRNVRATTSGVVATSYCSVAALRRPVPGTDGNA